MQFVCWLISLFFLTQSPCMAAMGPDLHDHHLSYNYIWAMYLDMHEVPHYLNYRGSKLHPLAKVRVRFRYFPPEKNSDKWPAKTYEELWYYDGKPVGLRRYGQL